MNKVEHSPQPDAKRKTIHWCAANKLTKSKASGGLGFRSFKEFNLAFLAKLAWNILLNPDALWVRLLKGLYYPHSDFISAPKHHRASWIWSSIIKGRDALLKGLRKNIGNGRDTMLDGAWIPDAPMFTANSACNIQVADCILQPQNSWDKAKLLSLFSPDTVRQIMTIPIGPPNFPDRWVWHPDNKGRFSVKSCYRTLRSEDGSHNAKEWKWLWHLSIPPKVRFFMWRLCNNALPSLTNLAVRNCTSTTTCPRCTTDEEDLHHIIFDCPHSSILWSQSEDTSISAAICAWTVWKSRNDKVFNNATDSMESLRYKFHNVLQDSLSLKRSSSSPASSREAQLQPILPPNNFRRTLLCDGSFTSSNQKAGYGIILYDAEGNATDGRAGSFECRAPICAEATAILQAVILAKMDNSPATIFTDCALVADALKNPNQPWPWDCEATLASITDALGSADWITIQHCKRQFVHKADVVARLARDNLLLPNWLETIV
ncbi:Putative ribonuclease H protein At1g65750 [Linum perenne]